MRSVSFVALATILIMTTSSPAGAQAWAARNAGTAEILESVWFTDVLNGWIVGDNGTTRFTNDGGATWSPVGLTGGDLGDVAFRAADVGLIVGDNGQIFRSLNGGAWSLVASGTGSNLLNVAFGGPTLAYASGRDGVILRSTDDGASWSVAETGAVRYRGAWAIGMSAWNVADGGVIRATTDGGANWFAQASGTTNDLRSVHFVSATEGWIAGSNSTILYTNDGGATWTSRNTGVNVGMDGIFFVDSNRGWAVGNAGTIYTTVNGGLSWVLESSGTVQNLNKVFFLGAGWGWSVGDAGALIVRDAVTAVEPLAGGPRPELLGNSPNPFVTSTRIHYALEGKGQGVVQLTVHDVTGRKIRNLVNGVLPAGAHAVTWDGRDESGVPAAGGVYFYRLRSERESRAGRMVLVR